MLTTKLAELPPVSRPFGVTSGYASVKNGVSHRAQLTTCGGLLYIGSSPFSDNAAAYVDYAIRELAPFVSEKTLSRLNYPEHLVPDIPDEVKARVEFMNEALRTKFPERLRAFETTRRLAEVDKDFVGESFETAVNSNVRLQQLIADMAVAIGSVQAFAQTAVDRYASMVGHLKDLREKISILERSEAELRAENAQMAAQVSIMNSRPAFSFKRVGPRAAGNTPSPEAPEPSPAEFVGPGGATFPPAATPSEVDANLNAGQEDQAP